VVAPACLCAAAKEPESLQRFKESEVIHGRWAMLGAAGVLGVEVLGTQLLYCTFSALRSLHAQGAHRARQTCSAGCAVLLHGWV
jgi:hypothetical protein